MKEIIIIKTNNGKEVKNFLEEKNIDYETYIPLLNYTKLHAEKMKMFADYGEVIKDKELEKEKTELEKADEDNEYDEYDQEEWAK